MPVDAVGRVLIAAAAVILIIGWGNPLIIGLATLLVVTGALAGTVAKRLSGRQPTGRPTGTTTEPAA